MYVRLYDLITFAYYTWCFDFRELESDLRDMLELAIRDGVNCIGLGNGKIVYLGEHDLNDVVELLSSKVEAILEELREEEYEETL
jgi:hypothetical protein